MAGTPEPPDRPEAGTLTVMVVEPEILVRMVIAEYLRACGYTVIEGTTAKDVFAVLAAGRVVDTVFAEVGLPGELDGFALATKIRESYAGVDVVLTSGVPNAAGKAGELCDEGPVAKPYHPQEVVRRINRLRERRRTSQMPLG